MTLNEDRCGLCSRAFLECDLRASPTGPGVQTPTAGLLCQQCWQVVCHAPWPDSSNSSGQNGSGGNGSGGLPPIDRRGSFGSSAHQRSLSGAIQHQDDNSVKAGQYYKQIQLQQQQLLENNNMPGKRSKSIADFQGGAGAINMPMPRGGKAATGWQSASMPEHPSFLSAPSGSNDPRWGVLAVACSGSFTERNKTLSAALNGAGSGGVPPLGSGNDGGGYGETSGAAAPAAQPTAIPSSSGRGHHRHHQPSLRASASLPSTGLPPASAPTFSPFELKSIMDEESLELFESQSHLLDDASKAALAKQRQYLDWQVHNSLTDAGPMQSVLERQDSAGSGSAAVNNNHNSPGDKNDTAHNSNGNINGYNASSPQHNNHRRSYSTSQIAMTHRLEDLERQLAVAQDKERQLQHQLQEYREITHCKMCQNALRNCVALPCMHFYTCDGCFKNHCTLSSNSGAGPSCPMCGIVVTGYQALIISK